MPLQHCKRLNDTRCDGAKGPPEMRGAFVNTQTLPLTLGSERLRRRYLKSSLPIINCLLKRASRDCALLT